MSYSVILPINYEALPQALLGLVKAHCRVRHSDDDVLLISYTGQAISMAEKVWGFRVFAAQIAWTPEPPGMLARYEAPAWPVTDFKVMSGSLDVSTGYQVGMTSMIEPWWLATKDGQNFPADAAVTLTAGYDDPAAMDPAMSSAILRVAAGLYENRETTGSTGGFVPSWIDDLLVGLWVPRA